MSFTFCNTDIFVTIYTALVQLFIHANFPWHHSENACLNGITHIASACMSKEFHFLFDNLGQDFQCPV